MINMNDFFLSLKDNDFLNKNSNYVFWSLKHINM